MNTHITFVVVAVMTTALLPAPAVAQTATAPPAAPAAASQTTLTGPSWEGVFSLGGWGTTRSGNTDRVAEYLVTDQDALAAVRAEFWGAKNGVRYDVTIANNGDARNQRYDARLDVRRRLKAYVSYQSLPHRLDHDPIDYLDAGSGAGGTFIVRNDDTDPAARYAMRYGLFDAGLTLSLKHAEFFVGHERQARTGAHQVMTVAHCANCHTVAFTKRYEEMNRTFSAGARLKASMASLEYTFTDRTYEDTGANPLFTYDNALQPATLQDIFLNRVQYDDANGPLPVAVDPAIRKFSNTLRGRLSLADTTLTGNLTQATTKNRDQGLAYDYVGGATRLFVPIGKAVSLRADFRRYRIDNDSVFVDVVEQTTPEGLAAGKTYSQAFPGAFPATFDFIRESSLNRTPTEFGVELSARPARRTYLRAGYGWQGLEREFFEVQKTTTNTLYLAGRTTLGQNVNGRFRVEWEGVRDPFMYERAAIPAILQPFASPGTPSSPLTGLQYYSMYQARQADLTSFPTRSLFVEGSATVTPTPRLAITGHYRWRDSQNDDLNYSEWGRTMVSPGMEVWLAADGRWAMSAGIVQQHEKLDTLFSTLAFGG
jgi:Putative outer membrane beta-barrel porin, MtrB/PioB